jgi:hypothetical protein
MVVGAVVGRQGNDWSRQDTLPLKTLSCLSRCGGGRHPITLTLTEGAPGCKETGEKRCKSANGTLRGQPKFELPTGASWRAELLAWPR